MRESLQSLVRKILLGSISTVSLVARPSLAEDPYASERSMPAGDWDKALSVAVGSKPRLILKRAAATEDLLLMAHRSHRSHSSHRSHYSSRVAPRPIPRPAPAPAVPATKHELGSRTLREGMRGADVTQLMVILAKHGYLPVSDLNAEQLFTDEVEKAVKKFQTQKKLDADGEVGPQTALALKQLP